MIGGEQRGQKILVVEDDLPLRNCFAQLLEFDGHVVESVDGGEAALAKLEHGQYDLVLTDYLMPRMNGDELALSIKDRWPNLPIILASGSMHSVSVFGNAAPGVDCMLNKPFSVEELREAIKWALDSYMDRQSVGSEAVGLLGNYPHAGEHLVDPPASPQQLRVTPKVFDLGRRLGPT